MITVFLSTQVGITWRPLLRLLAIAALILGVCHPQAASANNPVDEPEVMEVAARSDMAGYLHLMAADLLDELVYRWTENPTFGSPTRVVLVELGVPMGLNGNFQGFLEDRFFDLLTQHPETSMIPVHCGLCTELTVVSDPSGTFMGRGADVMPDFKQLPNWQNTKGLYLNFAIQGTELVLRSRLVNLDAERRIIAAQTLATSSSQPPLLRATKPLVSAEEVRREYISLLKEQDAIEIPIRVSVSFFAASPKSMAGQTITLPPMMWLQAGAETWISQRRRWLGGFFLGLSSMPETYDAWALGGRFSRLLGSGYRLATPNYYAYLETSYMELSGPASSLFRSNEVRTPDEIINEYRDRDQPLKITDGRIKLGVEMHLKSFYRAEAFLEVMPNQLENENLGKHAGIAHAWGFGMGVVL